VARLPVALGLGNSRYDTAAVRTVIQRAFAPFKAYLPRWIWAPIRSVVTAFLTPVLFSYRSGHFRSSLKRAAVSKDGSPLPWYTYPCIEFLRHRSFDRKSVLEFGGGQSTLWWAARAKTVVTIEGQALWYERLKKQIPGNVTLHLVPPAKVDAYLSDIERILQATGLIAFDVIILDGFFRKQLIDTAKRYLAADGMLICDDAETYGAFESFQHSGWNRVDFFGYAPGVVLPHCTSIAFGPNCFAFSSQWAIPVIARPEGRDAP
jgi:hypothetical protein